jgi:hypothetical protein
MRTVQLICPVCSQLVEIVDQTIAEHGPCLASGLRYVPSPRFQSGPGGPGIEVVGTFDTAVHCERCDEVHPAVVALLKVSAPDPANN